MTILVEDFKTEQLKYSRVKNAYSEKQSDLETLLNSKNIAFSSVHLYLRAYKHEGVLEVWAKNRPDQKYQLLTTYPICQSSGSPGPKRKEGDLQVPEGFYQINHFNPQSNFHLSLGINYPNKSDRVFADKNHPGGAIYIHGSCVTIGCIPITDDKIKELYILAVEAKNNGQKAISVTICPSRMTEANITAFRKTGNYSQKVLDLWTDLKTDYEKFEVSKNPSIVEFLPNGRHLIK